MQRTVSLAFISILLCIAQSYSSVRSKSSLLTSHSGKNPSIRVLSGPNIRLNALSRRNFDSRRVYLVFQARNPPPVDAASSLTLPTSVIHINVQLEPGSFPGAWPYTTIQLVKTPVDYHDNSTGQVSTRQIFQLYFMQMSASLGIPISHLADGREISLHDTHLMKFYLGTTTASDNTILEPHTGTGLLLQAIRSLPQIDPAPEHTRGAFMRNLVEALDIQPSSELSGDLITRMNSMIDLAQTNDMRSVYSDGHLLQDVFPAYRIPCIAHYQLVPHGSTGVAYSVLDEAEPAKSGRLREMEAMPNRTVFRDFLQRFVREPQWDGDLDDKTRHPANSTESDQ